MSAPETAAFPAALPHGPLRELFPDLYFVTGTTRPTFMGTAWQFSRNMVVVRTGGELSLINSVRLAEAGLAALEALGTVKHVIRLGAFHGMDDAFYLERYGAELWALAGMTHEHSRATDRVMSVGAALPWADGSLFVFESAKMPEGIILLAREGGILIACDSLQNWLGPDPFFDAPSAERMASMGFFRSANVGPGWRAACEPDAADFARLKNLSFRHLLSAHGEPLLARAHEQVSTTLADLYQI